MIFQAISIRTRSIDTISQFSMESSTSADSKEPVYIAAGDIRRRLSENLQAPKTKFEVKFQWFTENCGIFFIPSVELSLICVSFLSCNILHTGDNFSCDKNVQKDSVTSCNVQPYHFTDT